MNLIKLPLMSWEHMFETLPKFSVIKSLVLFLKNKKKKCEGKGSQIVGCWHQSQGWGWGEGLNHQSNELVTTDHIDP